MSTPFVAASSVAIVPVPTLPHRGLDPVNASSSTSFDDEKPEIVNSAAAVEDSRDGLVHGHVLKDGKRVYISWTKEEERRVVRKADFFLLPVLVLLFFWMALDRSNVSGVLTSSFLRDTGMTRDQANTGTSILWLGIVLLEVPSNILLQRVGPHIWISSQVILWGLVEVLHLFVHNPAGWYTARFALGLLESGFIPGALYTISRWYTKEELAKRTTIFFYGTGLSSAFGSLIAAGCISQDGKHGFKGWQWIFLVDGVCTIFSGVVALLLIPRSPRHTAGGVRGKGWFTEREADVFLARIETSDPLKEHEGSLKIKWTDVLEVLTTWRLYPHLLMCLSGLQSTLGIGVWGATIIKSLGFTAIRANLLSVPSPIIGLGTSFVLAFLVDRYRRYGYAIIFSGIWTLVGLIALYSLPIIRSGGSWGFYAALIYTLSAPGWQPINVTWLSLSMRTPAQRSIAYAVYIAVSNLGGTYGNQVFRGSDAPKYRKAWIACLSLGAVWLASTIVQTLQYQWSNRQKSKKWNALSPQEQDDYSATTTDQTAKRLDFPYPI